jgi:hypothetical protein
MLLTVKMRKKNDKKHNGSIRSVLKMSQHQLDHLCVQINHFESNQDLLSYVL